MKKEHNSHCKHETLVTVLNSENRWTIQQCEDCSESFLMLPDRKLFTLDNVASVIGRIERENNK